MSLAESSCSMLSVNKRSAVDHVCIYLHRSPSDCGRQLSMSQGERELFTQLFFCKFGVVPTVAMGNVPAQPM
jgi:hypothetical protein